jgi:peptidyl-prolyl cis-trans isomerase D
MAIIIAVALIIFVVMLAFENGGNLFRGGNTTSVGKVNGKSIEYADFVKKVDQNKANIEQQPSYYGPPPTGEALQQQANEAAWNQEINQSLQNSELQKLGIKVGKKEMGDILYGANPPDDLKRQFTDSTGVYNGQLAKQQIDQVLRNKSADPQQQTAREQLIGYINYLETSRQAEKYNSLLNNSINVPKWLVEKETADKSQMAKISFVRDNYAANADSTTKVSDSEIEEYISKHKKDFKQEEENRSISYVTFSASPSAADTAEVRDRIASLKPEFDTTTSVAAFLNRNGSLIPYSDIYAGKSLMQMQYKDTIQSLPINGVFGPFMDGGIYTLAKMLDVKQLPDSIKCRHILLGTVDRSGQPIMDDSVAHAKADSIALAIRNGANFDTLETKYSTDKKSHETKGEMQFSSAEAQGENFAKEFGEFILFGKPGDKKVVKTSFGYHYIEILSFIKVEPHYKVAYMAKPIEVSNETDNSANTEANQFAGDSRDIKSFDANAEKLKAKRIIKLSASNITPMAYEIQGLGASRSLVKKIYKAKRGEVLDPEKVDDKYVVAIVTEINEEGTVPVAKARINVEPLLRNKKIAEKLKAKIGTPATLEAASAVLGNKPIETIDSLRMTAEGQTAVSANTISSEPKVMGAAFNPNNKGKIVVIEGGNAIYVVRIDNVMATALGNANVVEQRKEKIQQAKQQAMSQSPLQALREAATIKDRRSDIF